ncbi:MAG: YdcF family protein [Leptolyngbya sp. SIO1E4]|nr:YdcF family protein [Leptolyngbya sp. SIO1E4]
MSRLTSLWTTFTWTLFDWASAPKILIPACLSIVLLALVIKTPKWFKALGKVVACLLAAYLCLATPLAASILIKGLTAFGFANAGESADAIVVLSRGDELGYSRYDLAIRLWQAHRAPKIFVTTIGRVGYMTARFKQEGWPLAALEGTTCARTTYEEAMSAAAILHPQHVEKVILITDSPHMLRSTLTLQALGFKVLPQVSPFPPQLPALDKSLLALREYLGLMNYAALGRLQEHPLDQWDRSSESASIPANCTVEWLDKV